MASTAVSNALSVVYPADETAFTFQTYETELANLRAHLEMVIRVRVLANLIWQYSDVDGRERISFFLDRQLSPSPSFALSYNSCIFPAPQGLLGRVKQKAEGDGQQGVEIEEGPVRGSVIARVNKQEIARQDYGLGCPIHLNRLEAREIVAWKALQVLRKDEKYSKYLMLQDLAEVQYFNVDLSKSGLSLEQQMVAGIERLPVSIYRALSCQKERFNLQVLIQNEAEQVICHLKLNGLPLYETANPTRATTAREAIHYLGIESGQYLLKMANALTHREFRIIENELLRRYPEQPRFDLLAFSD